VNRPGVSGGSGPAGAIHCRQSPGALPCGARHQDPPGRGPALPPGQPDPQPGPRWSASSD